MGRGGSGIPRVRQILGQAWPRPGPRSSDGTSGSSRQAAPGTRAKARIVLDLKGRGLDGLLADGGGRFFNKQVNDINHPLYRSGNLNTWSMRDHTEEKEPGSSPKLRTKIKTSILIFHSGVIKAVFSQSVGIIYCSYRFTQDVLGFTDEERAVTRQKKNNKNGSIQSALFSYTLRSQAFYSTAA